MPEIQDPPPLPPEIELERVLSMPEIMRLTTLSHDTIVKHYRHRLVRISPRRIGMRLKDVLQIVAVPA
jgi:hypothetical protein